MGYSEAVVYPFEICLLLNRKGLSNKYILLCLDSIPKGHSLRRLLFDASPPFSPVTQLDRTNRLCSSEIELIVHYKSFRKR